MAKKIFLFPVADKWLLHAPLHKITALLNDSAATALRHGRTTGALAALGMELAAEGMAEPKAPTGEVCPSFLGIIPTRGCNIGCVYCNFGGPTTQVTHMDPRIAVAAVDWMGKTLARHGKKIFQIHFFGGEPFVSPDIVDIVVHRCRYVSSQLGLVPYLDASTNGVFNESRCRFVGDYFGGIVLSFDGPPEYQNLNRPGFNRKPTYEVVAQTARRLSRSPLELCLRVCITQDSVHRMEEITRWMCQEFRPAIINFESLTPGDLALAAGLRVPDPYDFAVHCVGAYREAEKLGIRAVYSAAETEVARLSFCPVGTDALIVSLDGRVSGCYLLPGDWKARGLDMDLGWIAENGTVDLDFDAIARLRRLPAEKPRCEKCFCQWSCAGGCHVNQTYPGCGDNYSDFCIQTRLVTACLLLRQLGCEDAVDQLLSNREAMERLARFPADHFQVEQKGSRRVSRRKRTATLITEELARPRSLIADGMTLLG